MKKSLSRLLSLLLVLMMLVPAAGAAQVKYQGCQFGYSGNNGMLIQFTLSSGRPRTDLSVLSARDAGGAEHPYVTRATVYTPASDAVWTSILVREEDGTSSDSAEFIPCTATVNNAYSLSIQESGAAVARRSGDSIASALTGDSSLLLYRREVAGFEFCVILYFDPADSAGEDTAPDGGSTTPDDSDAEPGTPDTDPADVPEEPDQPEEPAQPEVPAASSGGKLVAGSVDMPQLSKQEIIDLLASASLNFSGETYDVQPSVTAPYQAGKMSNAALQAVLNRLNALRRIAGLPAASLDAGWSDAAQHGAVVLGALGNLSHTPSQPSGMDKAFYEKGYNATNSANIAAGYGMTGSVDGWMDDSDGGNIDRTGHRRWQLSPALTKVGFGFARSDKGYGSFAVEKVFERGAMSGSHSVDYDSFGWPSAGYFPNDLDAFNKDTAWSVSLNPDVYAAPGSGITVRISGGGKNWTLSGQYQAASSGAYLNVIPADGWNYGNNHTIIFRPDGVDKYEGVYTVEIDGLKSRKNNSPIPFTYTVEFFSTTQSNTPAAPDTPSTPTTPDTPTTPGMPGATPGTSGVNPFYDVPNGAYYTDAVVWAYRTGVTAGKTSTTFAPYDTCTRGQVVTFLWRAMGQPEPSTKTNPFRDVKAADYYYKAVLWAYENGITAGTTATAFSPDQTCTNGHVVTFLWRANGQPAANGTSALAQSFPSDYYTNAIAWADANGLLADTGSAFSPTAQSPRANIVTYLYRDIAQ